MNVFRMLLWPWRDQRSPPDAADVESLPDLTLEQYERLTPHQVLHEGEIPVVYLTPNRVTQWRVNSLFTKEPDTIEWIRGFEPGEVFVDIGANVGMYTIWAAKTRGVRTFAFEPESQNYALLCRNIVMNGLTGTVVAYCLALADKIDYSLLHLSEFQTGGSCHSFGEKVDFQLQQHEFALAQGCVSSTLDTLIEAGAVPVPNHIKIDVDGLEHKVLAGSRKVLQNPALKSVLVEINTNLALHRQIIADLEELGFTYSEKQVAAAQRSEGTFKGVGNYVFHR